MENKKRTDLGRFEVLKETGSGQLVGGFSVALAGTQLPTSADPSNNCNSTNCATGCGIAQNVVKGCGSK